MARIRRVGQLHPIPKWFRFPTGERTVHHVDDERVRSIRTEITT